MADRRKLQGEIDRCLKKVSEGVETFEDIWKKVHSATNANQKEKYEQDLKKEIKKLQRLRDQIKSWCASNDIKDKRILMDNRRLIETQMERFKIVEREIKTKSYSKEGLGAASKMDPATKEKEEMCSWVTNAIGELNIQVDQLESEMELLTSGSKKKRADKEKTDRAEDLKIWLDRHRHHIRQLETILRMLDNDTLDIDQVKHIQDDVQYYIESSQDPDFEENEFIYDDLDLEDMISDVVGGPQGQGIEDGDTLLSNLSGTPTSTNSSSPSPSPGLSNHSKDKNEREDDKRKHKSSESELSKSTVVRPIVSTVVANALSMTTSSKNVPPTTPTKPNSQIANHLASPPQPGQPYAAAASVHHSNQSNRPASSSNITRLLQRQTSADSRGSDVKSPSTVEHNGLGLVSATSQSTSVSLSAVPSSLTSSTPSTNSIMGSIPALPPLLSGQHQSQQQQQQQHDTQQLKPEVMMNGPVHSEKTEPRRLPLYQLQVSSSDSVLSTTPLSTTTAPPQHSVGSLKSIIVEQAVHANSDLGITQTQSATDDRRNKTSVSHFLGFDGSSTSITTPTSGIGAMSVSLASHLTTPITAPEPTTTTTHIPPLLGVTPLGSVRLSKEHFYQSALLDNAIHHIPQPSDSERLRHYLPRNPCPTPSYYPQLPPPHLDSCDFFQRLSTETLFFIFYYLEGTKAQYLSAKVLKKQSWRFHTKYMMWFQRHEEPKTITDEYEQGTYIYFDYEKWGQRKKEGFTFEYRYLEDRDLN